MHKAHQEKTWIRCLDCGLQVGVMVVTVNLVCNSVNGCVNSLYCCSYALDVVISQYIIN